MNPADPTTSTAKGMHFSWLICITIAVSVCMVVLSLIIFLRSPAYNTVKQISVASKLLANKKIDGIDTTSPIQSADIRLFAQSLDARISGVADESDFNPNIVNEEELGF